MRALKTLRHIIRCTPAVFTAAVLAALWAALTPARAAIKAQSLEKYTESHPLVIVTDWEFPPYEYHEDNGAPTGYNIEVLQTILDGMDIPHTFMMLEWKNALKAFTERKADLIILRHKIGIKDVYYGNTVLATYREGIAYKKGTAPPSSYATLGAGEKVGFKRNDLAISEAIRAGMNRENMTILSPRRGLHAVQTGKIKYYIYGRTPLLWLVGEFHLDDIEVSPAQLPVGTFCCASFDKDIISLIDDQFTRMEQSGQVRKLKNKWFHPEVFSKDASPVALYLIAGVALVIAGFLVLNWLVTRKIKQHTRDIEKKNTLITKVLTNSDHRVIRYDIRRRHVENVYGSMLPAGGMSYEEYISRIHPEDSGKAAALIETLNRGASVDKENVYRWNAGTPGKPKWQMLSVTSIVEYGSKRTPLSIISTVLDTTLQHEEEEAEDSITERFTNIFEKSIIGMAMYDADGRLLTVNDRMRSIFHFKNPDDPFYFNLKIFDLPFLREDINRDAPSDFHFCTQIHIPERQMYDYLEVRVRPIWNRTGELEFILLIARNINDDHDIYNKSRKNEEEIRDINEKMSQYENNLHFLLENINMKVWRSSLKERKVRYFSDLHSEGFTVTFDEFMDKVQKDIPAEKIAEVISPSGKGQRHKAVLPIKNLFEQDGKTHWYSIFSMPEYDSEGQVSSFFGIIRDITPTMDKQARLREETSRANESSRQKSTFLANMTHEIRTPLNAIVGFCNLLQSISDPNDKREFTHIISNNCDILLQLINDILTISAADSNGKLITPRKVDFSAVFNDICATLARRVENPMVEFVKDNPYPTLRTVLDSGRIQQVITNFVTNAIKYTREGHIKVGYRKENGGIRIYCEDTGTGIPKEKCQLIFDRFVKLNDYVQGTGLGLNICKTICEQCNGRIGVDSEVGRGSTFWIWIPCTLDSTDPCETPERRTKAST